MKKKLAILAAGCALVIIISGFQSTMLYGTEYMHARSGYTFTFYAATNWSCFFSGDTFSCRFGSAHCAYLEILSARSLLSVPIFHLG